MKAEKYGTKYRITYRCPGFPKLIHESFDTEAEANLRIAQIELDKQRGTLLPPTSVLDGSSPAAILRETMTVKLLMEEYVKLYGLNHWSEGTLSVNLHRINDYIIPYLGDVKIKTITTHSLEAFYLRLQNEPAVKMKGREDEDKCISFSVIEKVHSILRSALNQAIRWDYLRGSNPAMAVELPKHKKVKRDVWTDQEARIALSQCDDPQLLLCMYLALGCSMRIGEILGLTWDCVHIEDELVQSDEAYLFVEKELRRCNIDSLQLLQEKGRDEVFLVFPPWKRQKRTTDLVLKTPKTESSVRSIYIPAVVVEELKKMRQQQEYLKSMLTTEYQDYNLVIVQENGRPVEERFIAKKFKDFIHQNGLREVVFHSLRHSSTSVKLKLSGGDIKAVQGDTGHAQANMVTDVYSHIMNDDRKRLARKMNDEFFLETEKAAAQPPMSESMAQLMQLLQTSPEIAAPLLQMSQILGTKVTS